MFLTLAFATNNAHKLEEVRAMVGDKFSIKSLDDLNCYDDIPETGTTFEENASLKSIYVFKAFKMNCFADDSGLEINALDGKPGVYSARYSGTRDSEKNMQLVLDQLQGITNRKANFRTVISLIFNGDEHLFEGSVYGTIRTEQSGVAGFGYDPIFEPDGFDKTFAEMTADEKNKISHRAIALEKMVTFLQSAI